MDEPFSDPSLIPTYLLSLFTRKHVTVALGGDGGDEIFAGYPMYRGHHWAEIYARIPGFLKAGLIEPMVHMLPKKTKNLSFFRLQSDAIYHGCEIRSGRSSSHLVWLFHSGRARAVDDPGSLKNNQ